MKETYHIISKRDLKNLIRSGDVVLDKINRAYDFHGGYPRFIRLYTEGMMQDIITSRRRSFDYDMDIDDPDVDDPFLDGISGEYSKWFVPIWCVVEWLKKRGLL